MAESLATPIAAATLASASSSSSSAIRRRKADTDAAAAMNEENSNANNVTVVVVRDYQSPVLSSLHHHPLICRTRPVTKDWVCTGRDCKEAIAATDLDVYYCPSGERCSNFILCSKCQRNTGTISSAYIALPASFVDPSMYATIGGAMILGSNEWSEKRRVSQTPSPTAIVPSTLSSALFESKEQQATVRLNSCAICVDEIPRDPFEVDPCGCICCEAHCKEFVVKNQRCPVCSSEATAARPSASALRQIASLEANCINDERGCNEKFTASGIGRRFVKLEEHLKICSGVHAACYKCDLALLQPQLAVHLLDACPFRWISCEHCQQVMLACQMTDHIIIKTEDKSHSDSSISSSNGVKRARTNGSAGALPCYGMMVCENNSIGCGTVIRRTPESINEHNNTCALLMIPCDICDTKVPRSDMALHMNDAMAVHLMKSMIMIRTLQAKSDEQSHMHALQMNEQRKELVALRSENNQLVGKLDAQLMAINTLRINAELHEYETKAMRAKAEQHDRDIVAVRGSVTAATAAHTTMVKEMETKLVGVIGASTKDMVTAANFADRYDQFIGPTATFTLNYDVKEHKEVCSAPQVVNGIKWYVCAEPHAYGTSKNINVDAIGELAKHHVPLKVHLSVRVGDAGPNAQCKSSIVTYAVASDGTHNYGSAGLKFITVKNTVPKTSTIVPVECRIVILPPDDE